jgi:hypothetical protein
MNFHGDASYRNLLLILFIYFFFMVSAAVADNHNEKRHGHQHDRNIFSYDLKKGDKGNELTGEMAAWMFVIANITVVISLLFKGMVRFTPLGTTLKEKIKSLNRFQKKYLLRFHYFLNPVAMIIAFVHFSLSRCGTSFLPDLGLVLMAVIGVAGIFVKFKISPKSIQRAVYWLHTDPMPLGFGLIILVAGHSIID